MGSGKGKSGGKKAERKLRAELADAVARAERAEERAARAKKKARRLARQVEAPAPDPPQPRPEIGSPADIAAKFAKVAPEPPQPTPTAEPSRAGADLEQLDGQRLGWFAISQAVLFVAVTQVERPELLPAVSLVGVVFCWVLAAGMRASAERRRGGGENLQVVHTYLLPASCQVAWVVAAGVTSGAITGLVALTLTLFLVGFVRWAVPD